MNSKILNSILNGALKPWLITFDDDKILKNIVKQVQNKPNTKVEEIKTNLSTLLQPFPSLLKQMEYPIAEPIIPLTYTVSLPVPTTLFNHYYKSLIDEEIARYFNVSIQNPFIQDNTLDVPFQIGHKSLKGIADLCNQINNEIAERGFADNSIPLSDTTFFALTYLRNSLLALYFSIQELFKEHLTTVYNSFDEFALHCLDNDCKNVQLNSTTTQGQKISTPKETAVNEPQKLSFGYKGQDTNKLLNLFNDLCIDITFLNEEKTTVEALVDLLTTKEIIHGSSNIFLGCQTTEFVFVMDNLSKQFQRLTPTNIEKSMCFWSKPISSKNPTLISSDNYFKTRAKSKMRIEKQEVILATIQKYFP